MKRELRLQARELRKQGLPLNDIVAALGVAKSSVSLWVRDIVLTDDQIQQIKEQRKDRLAPAHQKGANSNREKFRKLRLSYQMEGRSKAGEGRPLHMMGCMLYWAEGAKARCIVPEYSGTKWTGQERKALWDRYFTAAPAQQRQSVAQYKTVKRA